MTCTTYHSQARPRKEKIVKMSPRLSFLIEFVFSLVLDSYPWFLFLFLFLFFSFQFCSLKHSLGFTVQDMNLTTCVQDFMCSIRRSLNLRLRFHTVQAMQFEPASKAPCVSCYIVRNLHRRVIMFQAVQYETCVQGFMSDAI